MAGSLADLFKLARDRSPAGRRTLAQRVSGFFLAHEARLSERERDLVVDILNQLLHDAEMEVRLALAERLAGEPSVPRELLTTLANDRIEVARPVLLRSLVLSDDDLIEIARTRGDPHRLAIAGRAELSARVVEALVESGGPEVACAVVANPGARVSGRALAALAALARYTVPLQRPLVERPEMTSEIAAELYWWVSVELRTFLLRRFDVDAERIDQALESTVQMLIEASRDRRTVAAAQMEMIDQLARAEAITPKMLIQVLRLNQIQLFLVLFAQTTGLDPQATQAMLTEPGSEALALACRALDIDKANFASIFLLSRAARPGDQQVDPRELSRVLALYDRLNPADSAAVLASWRQDPSSLTARSAQRMRTRH